ncbi:MAG: DUF4070 domain-containing protein [Candidatus Schekmanbacteria bacterium]|nr:DUF4070 domain-containing protein [Candidatus Schekmanbacteria bacterium]
MTATKLLLLNPANGPSFWGLDHAVDIIGCAYSNAPLALITVAALTPDDWQVALCDENVQPVDLDFPCDVVGITAMNVQATRAFELADAFRARGRTVVMGGPFATLDPDRCQPHVDVVFAGEAERTFPAFCRDFAAGDAVSRYTQADHIDLAESPVPRYDLLRPAAYAALPVQTTRGCPFNCEFCDIIVMSGRRVRTKPASQVLAEIDAIRALGHESIFFTDDNFVGKLGAARDLLVAMRQHFRATGDRPLLFTQASVNLADQADLLELMVEAGFTRVFLGIESPRQESLREAGKRQNVRGDLVARIHAIQRAGLMVWAGMIVGFDHDDAGIFAEQEAFLDEAGIAVAMVGLLNAPPRTPLFARLQAAGRIAAGSDWTDNCAWTNIIPKQMTRGELFTGYAELLARIYSQESYARRVLANIGRMGPPRQDSQKAARLPGVADLAHFARAAALFTLSPRAERRRHFLPNLLRVLRNQPRRAVEAAIHLGLWRHFERYVPDLVDRLRAATARESLSALAVTDRCLV